MARLEGAHSRGFEVVLVNGAAGQRPCHHPLPFVDVDGVFPQRDVEVAKCRVRRLSCRHEPKRQRVCKSLSARAHVSRPLHLRPTKHAQWEFQDSRMPLHRWAWRTNVHVVCRHGTSAIAHACAIQTKVWPARWNSTRHVDCMTTLIHVHGARKMVAAVCAATRVVAPRALVRELKGQSLQTHVWAL